MRHVSIKIMIRFDVLQRPERQRALDVTSLTKFNCAAQKPWHYWIRSFGCFVRRFHHENFFISSLALEFI